MEKVIQANAARMRNHPDRMLPGPVEEAMDAEKVAAVIAELRRRGMPGGADLREESSQETPALLPPLSAIGSRTMASGASPNRQSAKPRHG